MYDIYHMYVYKYPTPALSDILSPLIKVRSLIYNPLVNVGTTGNILTHLTSLNKEYLSYYSLGCIFLIAIEHFLIKKYFC
jgi:hypothetical protein